MSGPIRYRSADEDSARWAELPRRDGDLVISTRSKHGTTWMQMICALLVFRTAELPRPLAELSPWLDWLVTPVDEVVAELEAQTHRRFIKTHTPLDGLPEDDRLHTIVVARHPLDAAVSLHHQGFNIDRDRVRRLVDGSDARPAGSTAAPKPLDRWLVEWIDGDPRPADALDSLPGVAHHLTDAWRRRHRPNVTLVHYADLLADLAGEMGRLAARLGIDVDPDELERLAAAARFDAMADRADELAPDRLGILRDRRAFFRRGRSGAGAEVLSEAELARYHQRMTDLAPPDLLAWLHR